MNSRLKYTKYHWPAVSEHGGFTLYSTADYYEESLAEYTECFGPPIVTIFDEEYAPGSMWIDFEKKFPYFKRKSRQS